MDKNIARLRRAKSTRARIRSLGVPRLSVLRTGQHIYAQLFSADGSKVLAAASTTQADVKDGLGSTKNKDAAARVGKLIAERAKAEGIEKIAFDRSGYRYHGRVKALGEAARESGLRSWPDARSRPPATDRTGSPEPGPGGGRNSWNRRRRPGLRRAVGGHGPAGH